MAMLGQKMKVTLELDDGTFYELDAISSEITQRADFLMDVSEHFLPGKAQVEMSFVGVGDITTGIKKTMIVCIGCGSEWHDAEYHPGTCANCGWGAMDTKREIDA